jgi:hypothetical protein
MRKSFDGLFAEARRQNVQLLNGEGIVFVGENKRLMKILYDDGTGLVIVAKRFSHQCMRTRLRFLSDASIKSITRADVAMLMEGKDYEVKRQPLERSAD